MFIRGCEKKLGLWGKGGGPFKVEDMRYLSIGLKIYFGIGVTMLWICDVGPLKVRQTKCCMGGEAEVIIVS